MHGTLRVDPEAPLGADPVGRLRLYAPDPVDPGSSISHWDMLATPDLLMEPFIAPGAPIGESDLTIEQLKDLGWASGSSNIVVHYTDAQGQGFSAAGSLGAQRRAAIEHVAEIWSDLLQSTVPIHLDVSFQSMPCGDGSATLAQAGPTFIFESFSGAHIQNAWYPGALAEALSGQNLSLDDDVNPQAGDIHAMFNIGIDNGCLGGGSTFDYALDGTAQPGRLSFVNVALHEIGHGLGFVSLVNESTGANPHGQARHLQLLHARHLDRPAVAPDEQRRARRVGEEHRTPGVGRTQRQRRRAVDPHARPGAPDRLAGERSRQLRSRARRSSGPTLRRRDQRRAGTVNDGTASPREGCQPFTNAAAVRGRIALVVRGNCNYAIKAAHAQDAGATGLIVVNNVPGPPMAPGGTDTSITIPVVMIRQGRRALLFQALTGSQPTPTRRRPRRRRTPTPTPTPSPTPTTQPPNSEPGTLDPIVTSEAPSTCVANGTTLCLENNRFRVRARWTTAPARPATATPRPSPVTPAPSGSSSRRTSSSCSRSRTPAGRPSTTSGSSPPGSPTSTW